MISASLGVYIGNPSAYPALLLAGAAVAFYLGSRIGVLALDRPPLRDGGAAIAHWLPIAATALWALRDEPQVAISIIFSTSVACLTLVMGVVLLSHASAASGEQQDRAVDKRFWAMILPAAVLALLAGFSARFTLLHAIVFFAQGCVAAMIWSSRLRLAHVAAPRDGTYLRGRDTFASIIVELGFWIAATALGVWLAMRSVHEISASVPQFTAGLFGAVLIAPAIALPMIGSGLAEAREGRIDRVISMSVECVLLNLGLLLPLVIVAHRALMIRQGAGWPTPVEFSLSDTSSPTLPFPMAAWRLDTVVILVVGAALVLFSTGRWIPRRVEGLALVAAFAAYMWFSSEVAGR